MSESDSPSEQDYSQGSGAVRGGWLFLIIIGLALMGFGGYMYLEHQSQVQDFEQTEATIISSDVEEDRGIDTDDVQYYPEISYEYTVDGERYQNSNVFPGEGIGKSANAQSVVNNHPAGAEVTAYYNPDDPSESFLIKSGPPWIRILASIAVGILFILGGIADLIRRRRS